MGMLKEVRCMEGLGWGCARRSVGGFCDVPFLSERGFEILFLFFSEVLCFG